VGGTWVGYLFAVGGCAVVVGLVLGAAFFLYAVGRVQERRRPKARVRVLSVSASAEPEDAA
jgi:hypothetical protein